MEEGEVADDLLASLRPAALFAPAAEGFPGRRLEDLNARFRDAFLDRAVLANPHVFEAGRPGCDHDFGLESWTSVFETSDGLRYTAEESFSLTASGTYYNTVTCTRCGAKHGFPESL